MSSSSTSLSGNTDNEKLLDLCNKSYKEQAIWFLNAYWDQHGSDSERVWDYVHKCAELDIQRHGDGNALDEVMAHRFLELLHETLTVMAMRDRLRKTGALSPTERPKLVPLTHYLLFHYDVDWRYLVNTKGDNSEEIAEAQRLLDEVVTAFQESERQANNARKAEAAARKREDAARETENEARAAEEAARQQEAPFKAAQEEVDAALREVKSQEEARESRMAELKRKSTEGGVVQQNKAKNELAQHLAEDPLPLRKAKITLEAALKKAEKARAPFEAATKAAETARAAAEEAREAAEESSREA